MSTKLLILTALYLAYGPQLLLARELGEFVEANLELTLPPQVALEKWPCDFRGKEWITYDVRTHPKFVDRKGTLKTFGIKLQSDNEVLTGFRRTCMYKVIDESKNRFLQALDERTVSYGPYHVWRKDGMLVESGFYKDSVPHGKRLQYDAFGNIARQTDFVHGKVEGLDVYLTDRGKRCEDQFKAGIIVRHRCFFAESQVLWKDESYLNGLKHGLSIVNHPNGQPELLEPWHLGEFHGVLRHYRLDGDRYFLFTESDFLHGKKQGQSRIWDWDGRRVQ
jgi:antitoxin component YwqK of YwqJK toxin-antitoxin module